MSLITVEVTQEDIDHGAFRSCWSCPVARGLSRACGQPMECGSETFLPKGGLAIGTEAMRLPQEATNFIRRFDMVESVEPFSFQVEVPDEWIQVTA